MLTVEPFRVLEAVAVPIDEVNVDTDQLCPTRFNKVPRRPDYEHILFHDRRFDAEGNENPDFILNRQPYRQARIIVAGLPVGHSAEFWRHIHEQLPEKRYATGSRAH
jgi:3-isopropylmalate/(R)-2-methylmalate dehydratase small subunit